MELSHDHFTIIYKILSTLEENMETGLPLKEEFFNNETLGISKQKFAAYLEMLYDSGYVKNLKIDTYMRNTIIDYVNMKITLKGLEYLANNTLMQRAYKIIHKITDVAAPVTNLL